ncbi:MAG: hypothetical protein WKG52_05115 [Variovorax sp.]
MLDYAGARDRLRAAQELMRKSASTRPHARRPLRGVDHRHPGRVVEALFREQAAEPPLR